MFWSTYLSLKVCTWYILLVFEMVCTGMYWVHTSTYFFLLIWYCISFVSAGYIRAPTEDFWVHTLQIMCILLACRALPVCLQANPALEHAFNQSTLHKVCYLIVNCCLASASAWLHDWALVLVCWGNQLLLVSFAWLAVVKLSRWWSLISASIIL